MSKLTIRFNVKKDKNKNDNVDIYTKIKFGPTSTTMFTGKYINPSRWKLSDMLLKANKIHHEISLKNYLYNIPTEIDKVYINLKKEGLM